MNATQIIETLQSARESQNLKVYALAQKTGLPPITISKIEQSGGAQLRTIVTIADALGLELILRPTRSAKITSNTKNDTDAY